MDEKYYCRNCRGQRKHKTLFEKVIRGSDSGYNYQWIDKYLVIECAGCETISFVKNYGDSEMYEIDRDGHTEYYDETTVFPKSLEMGLELQNTHLLPISIRTIYDETIDSLKADCSILSAGGFRAIIEAICNHLEVNGKDLSIRIDSLFENGYLSNKESNRLHSVRFLGNDSLHKIEKPRKEQLQIVLEIINHLLENLFIQDKRLEYNIDVMIKTYEDFIKLIRRHITQEKTGMTVSITDIFGKAKRQLSKQDFSKFEKQLLSDIREGKIDFLTISDNSQRNSKKFKIVKVPEPLFDW